VRFPDRRGGCARRLRGGIGALVAAASLENVRDEPEVVDEAGEELLAVVAAEDCARVDRRGHELREIGRDGDAAVLRDAERLPEDALTRGGPHQDERARL